MSLQFKSLLLNVTDLILNTVQFLRLCSPDPIYFLLKELVLQHGALSFLLRYELTASLVLNLVFDSLVVDQTLLLLFVYSDLFGILDFLKFQFVNFVMELCNSFGLMLLHSVPELFLFVAALLDPY